MIHIILSILLQAVTAFLLGTLLFDLVHYLLHHCLKSTNQWLQWLGKLHLVHHHFYTPMLQINEKWTAANLRTHAVMEYVVQMTGILVCLSIFSPPAIILAALFQTGLSAAVILYWHGVDPHHQPLSRLPSYVGGPWVTRNYHALHHVYPANYYSSYLKLLDFLLGTGNQITDKTIVMTGTSGALGSKMKSLLEKEGAHIIACKYGLDYTYDNYDKLIEPLTKADVILLCHGSKYEHAQEANCDSFVRIIELFKSLHPTRLTPLEIWAVGSEIECHPTFGIKQIKVYADSKRQYAHYARHYYRDRQIQYRHLVHSAFISRMGPGLMTAGMAAWWSVFLLKRGFRYIPVTYTGFAFINYLRFVFNK